MMTPTAAPLAEALRLLAEGRSLTARQSSAAFGVLVAGEAHRADAATLLLGLKAKGESAEEVAGAAAALRAAMVPMVAPDPDDLVDTCGTGGGRVGTLNISTGAAFIAAGAGVRIAKHGNRSYTSRSGSADVLEALGIRIELSPTEAAATLADTGFTFMYAPAYHPAMRHVAAVRKELGVPTMMNLVGPLANPAGVGRQVLGAAHAGLAPILAEALLRLRTRHAMVVHADVGMDEISPVGPTRVWEVRDGEVAEWALDPADYGHAVGELGSIAGGEPGENAARIEHLLRGGTDDRAARSALVLNAAAAIYVSGLADDFSSAVQRAEVALATGQGAEVLARVRAASTSG